MPTDYSRALALRHSHSDTHTIQFIQTNIIIIRIHIVDASLRFGSFHTNNEEMYAILLQRVDDLCLCKSVCIYNFGWIFSIAMKVFRSSSPLPPPPPPPPLPSLFLRHFLSRLRCRCVCVCLVHLYTNKSVVRRAMNLTVMSIHKQVNAVCLCVCVCISVYFASASVSSSNRRR